jgi:phosphoribosylformylglycinamidine synthase
MKSKVLIPIGYGLNCEDETAYAFEMVGAQVDRVHLKDLFSNPDMLSNYHLLALIGGFSFGDHISAGKVLANLYKSKLNEEIMRFISEGKLIFGECNGFQVMVKLGILPGLDNDYNTQKVTLVSNDSGVFEDRWVTLRVNTNSKCVFTKGIRKMYLPVRHGEGKFVVADKTILDYLNRRNMITMQYAQMVTGAPTMEYPFNPNGSIDSIAGICDPTGRIFGLMPHPTAYLSPYNHPSWGRLKLHGKMPEKGEGVKIFENAIEYIRKNLS